MVNEQSGEGGQLRLLTQRRFAPFFATQFLGAANDNVFKFAVTALVGFQSSTITSMPPELAVNLIAGLFVVPFLLFSATSGQIADKYDKGRLMRLTKLAEVAIMLLAAWGFYVASFPVLLLCVFLMGTQSTLFGPVKYAYLPERLEPDELVGGNGLVEMGTFVAILLGTVAAGVLMDTGPDGHLLAAAVCVGLALVGVAASAAIPSGRRAAPRLAIDWNPVRVTWTTIRVARRSRAVFLSLLGISWLWFFGAVFLTQIVPFTEQTLGGGQSVATLLLAVFSIGIGLGSLACDRMSRHQVEIGLVPFGSLGMTIFTVDLYFATRGQPVSGGAGIAAFLGEASHWRVLADLFGVAMFAGFYSVPLYALIQLRSEATHKARIIAANNILNALFMVVSAGFAAVVLGQLGASIPVLFLVTGVLNLVVAVYIYTLVPEFLLRFLSWILVNTVYRLRADGRQHIPAEGPAVIVSNHVSFADALVLMAISPRPIRFVMEASIFRAPVLSWLFRQVKAIPIAPAKVDAALMERAFERVSDELRAGQLVCIFPEGRITDTGELSPFRPGITRILERDPVPVIPVAIQGLWGSFFSRKSGKAMTRPLRRGVLSKIGIVVGAPVPPESATPELLQHTVGALRGDWR